MLKTIKNPKLILLYKQMYKCNKCKELKKLSCNIYNGKENGPLRGGGASNNCTIFVCWTKSFI